MARVSGGENSKRGTNRDLVWAAKEAFQESIEAASFKIKLKPVFVSVEPTIERKGWYKCYFANLRALSDMVNETRFQPDAKAMAIYNTHFELVGKVNRKTTKFEWYQQVEALGTTIVDLEARARE